MKRRHFLTKFLLANSLACGFDAGESPTLAQVTEHNIAVASKGIARFEELSKALDRDLSRYSREGGTC
jgi:hypothetical protein